MSVGTNLRKLRTQAKKTQQEIADELEIDRNTYANWENDTNDIKGEYLLQLADIFGVELKDLFSDEKGVKVYNKSKNRDHATGVVINISDKETSEKLLEQITLLVKLLQEK
ncbi:MAG: helix-turn-helix domain-containing protein [Flavobacteriaceae bacterium]|jgi:transcriptional regulator with XRE-family HTH domain|nr:helix-turn-helix domain-containing protein [Flavobacteriaceae bacterium]